MAVCLNPAWDVTYRVPGLTVGASHRVESVGGRAGGKGVNVARVLCRLHHDVLLLGLLGGPTGAAIAGDVRDAGIPYALTAVESDARRTITVVDPDHATAFNERGGPISAGEWTAFRAGFAECAGNARVVVLSGSLPPGVPPAAYRDLTDVAHDAGAIVIVDADGEALQLALAGAPDVVKPNAQEAAELLGLDTRTRPGALAAAQALRAAGPRSAVVSRGAAGLVAAVPGWAYTVRGPERVAGNPTGAGDTVTALIAAGLATDQPWPEILRRAAAAGAATVAGPQAGEFDQARADDFYRRVTVEEQQDR